MPEQEKQDSSSDIIKSFETTRSEKKKARAFARFCVALMKIFRFCKKDKK